MKLSEFARIYGVSERHARRLLAENEADMCGHYERRGKEGTFLDNIGVDILKSKLSKTHEVQVLSSSERERQLETTLTELSMRYAAAMEKIAENAGTVALLEAAKEKERELEDRVKHAEDERQQAVVTLEVMRREAKFRADSAFEAEEQRIEAEKRAQEAEKTAEVAEAEAERAKAEAEDLRAKLEQIAAARGLKRRKLLKDLKRRNDT